MLLGLDYYVFKQIVYFFRGSYALGSHNSSSLFNSLAVGDLNRIPCCLVNLPFSSTSRLSLSLSPSCRLPALPRPLKNKDDAESASGCPFGEVSGVTVNLLAKQLNGDLRTR